MLARARLLPAGPRCSATALATCRPAASKLLLRSAACQLQRHAASPAAASPSPAPLLSDERITAPVEYNRWLQLFPACTTGLVIGTYFAIPGVLGPSICRAQGVVAPAFSDFTVGQVVPTYTYMSLLAGLLAATLATRSASFGMRRLGVAGGTLFPLGIYVMPAAAVWANSLPAYAASTIAVAGVGFYCIYPQIPPFLTSRWFPDRKGLAVSIYFCAFGAGVLFATRLMQPLLAHFRTAPTRLGSLADVPVSLGEQGQRLAEVSGRAAEVVVATQRDLLVSGFSGLEDGVFVVGSGSNGVSETMAVMGAVCFGMLQLSGWSYRLPAEAAAAAAAAAEAEKVAAASSANGEQQPAGGGGGLTLAEAQRGPNLYLLGVGTFGLGVTGLPFLLNGKFMINDVFGGADLPSATITAAAAAFPAIIASANMGGRLLWGPVSDAVGRQASFGIFGANAGSLLLLPLATGMVGVDPRTAL